MLNIVDLHNHSLFDLDDGATSYEEMCSMISASYASGVRSICFTPHYRSMDGEELDVVRALEVLEIAKKFCGEKYPDMELYLGSELLYHYDCIDALANNRLFTMGGSRYVLVDFSITVDKRGMVNGIERLINSGYIPIVAHVERYYYIFNKLDVINQLSSCGALIQINAESLQRGMLSKTRRWCLRLISNGLVDIISSDAHDMLVRTPVMERAVSLVSRRFGEKTSRMLFSENGRKILLNERI